MTYARIPRGAPRVVVLGWHGATERNLGTIARVWQSLGAETETFVPDTWRGMSRPHGWTEIGTELATKLAETHARDPRPLIFHSFSNAGFWTLVATLDAAARSHQALRAAHRGTILDSAPGFPEKVTASFTAKYASMAMAPALLAALGREPRHRHWLVSPPLALFLGLWHWIAPAQVRFMERSQALFIALSDQRPLTLLYGDADELVPAHYVEAFAERARRALPVRSERFEGSGHVRHFIGQRARYQAILSDVLRMSSGERPN